VVAVVAVGAAASLLAAQGCKREEAKPAAPGAAAPALATDRGVDLERKVVRVGLLNDESGPGAAIGRPYALGKRILFQRVNAGELKLLPEGWRIEAVEKDHAYNPQQAVQHYGSMKDEVLFVAHSFGTPNTLPLRDMLTRDGVVAFPASLSSLMAEHELTPPLGPSYALEAMRAVEFAVQQAGGAGKVKLAVVYQQDDYGKDGVAGVRRAAGKAGAEVVAEVAVAPGQKDYTATMTALQQKGATHVVLATLPSATGPVLGTSAQLQFRPVFIGITPAWVDAFFSEKVLPPAVLANFYWSSGMPYWGEEAPGMKDFLAAWEKYKPAGAQPDAYVLMSYAQGVVELEALRRAIERKDVTRKGFLAALHSIDAWDGGGMMQPMSLAKVPYVTSTRTRVLKPNLASRTWETAAPFAQPVAMDVP
jgi:ABC-type branched-subunit amino acid transport system substrate-binding protein